MFNGLSIPSMKLRCVIDVQADAPPDGLREAMEKLHQSMLDDLNQLGGEIGWAGVEISRYGFSAKHRLVSIHAVAGVRPATLDDLRAVAERRKTCTISG